MAHFKRQHKKKSACGLCKPYKGIGNSKKMEDVAKRKERESFNYELRQHEIK